jgi:hypothetical protein
MQVVNALSGGVVEFEHASGEVRRFDRPKMVAGTIERDLFAV